MPFPSSIPNLVSRWRSSSITGLVHGDPVTTVVDEGPAGNNLTNATAARKPTYKTNSPLGKPYMDFATDDYLLGISNGLTNTSNYCFIVVYYLHTNTPAPGTAGTARALFSTQADQGHAFVPSTDIEAGAFVTTGTMASLLGQIAWQRVFNQSSSGYTTHYVERSAAGVTSVRTKGGAALPVNNPNTVPKVSPAGPPILGSDNTTARFFDGDVYEVLVYDRVLSDLERSQVNSYIQDTYGIAVADYVAPAPTGPAEYPDGYIKTYIGNEWVAKPLKVWNSTTSQWVQKPIKFWNGTAWVPTPGSGGPTEFVAADFETADFA